MQWSLFVLILMGQCSFCLCRLYEYHFVRNKKTWEEAQTYCREHHTDLAKVFDMTDVKRLHDSASNQGEAWIGLRNQNNVDRTWLWSLPGVKFTDSETEWDDGQPDDHNNNPENCVMMKNHKWHDAQCSNQLPFICYDETKQQTFHLIKEWKIWLEAQSYCREHHTDLVSGPTQFLKDEEFKTELEPESYSRVWIGLFRDTWRWSDESSSSFRFWDPVLFKDEDDKRCAVTVSNGKWSSDECNNTKPFFCYDDPPLQCQNCTDEQCSSTTLVTCSSETMCVTASIRATSSGTPAQQIVKACASSSLCPATGSHTFSANLGVSSAVASAECCDTDNCNAETLPFPAAQTVNALECFTCDPVTSHCASHVQCRGEENLCFQASVTSGSMTAAFGCVSTNMCAAAESLGSIPFMQSVGSISSGPSCCGISLCNTAPTSATAAPTSATAAPTSATAAPTSTTAAPTSATAALTSATAAPTSATAAPTSATAAPTSATAAPTSATAAPTTTPALEPGCDITDEVILIKENKTWDQALTYCRENHHDLISITNPQKQRWAEEVAKQANSPYVWTGVRFICDEGLWFWVSDKIVCYNNWSPHCEWDSCGMSGAMETGGEYKWFKKYAAMEVNFICSKR